MKNKYDDEIFNFFTSDEDSFKMMGKIAQHEPSIRKRLIEGFWTELLELIKKEFENKKEEWVVGFSNDFTISWNKIMIYQKSWCFDEKDYPLISISFEDLYFGRHPLIGVLVHEDYGNRKSYNTEGIKKLVRLSEVFQKLNNKKSKWYPAYMYTSLSLDDYEAMLDILPANKKNALENLLQESRFVVEMLNQFMKDNNNLAAFKI